MRSLLLGLLGGAALSVAVDVTLSAYSANAYAWTVYRWSADMHAWGEGVEERLAALSQPVRA